MKRIVLHIDRLMLRGFRHHDRDDFTDGLRQELIRQFSLPQDAGRLMARPDVSRLRPASVTIARGERPRQIGSRVAQQIGRGVKR